MAIYLERRLLYEKCFKDVGAKLRIDRERETERERDNNDYFKVVP